MRQGWFVLLFSLGATGCSSLAFWADDAPEATESKVATDKSPAAKPAADDDAPSEQELKMARLWARVDELEEEQYRQKERLRVLEKGLTLGLLPEELKYSSKNPKSKGGASAKPAAPKDLEEQKAPTPTGESGAKTPSEKGGAAAEGPKPSAPATLSKEDQQRYQSALTAAHDLYRSGRYGRAIVEYAAIGKTFGEATGGGVHVFWLGMCWAGLKEFNTARQQYLDFLHDHGDSPWTPRAKLELARTEWQLGLRETALDRLRDLIKRHPFEDASEMAKMELDRLDKKI